MANPYTHTVHGVFPVIEVNYGTPVAATGADFTMPISLMKLTENYVDAGEVGMDTRSAGDLPMTRQSGLWHEGEFEMYVREQLTAYSLSVKPRDIYSWIFAASHSRTYNAGTWSFKPITDAFDSLSIETYAKGEKRISSGVLVKSFKLSAEAGKLVKSSFSWQGIGALPTQAAMPDVSTYNTTDGRMKFDGKNAAITVFGNSTLNVKSFDFSVEYEQSIRTSGNVPNTVVGFVRGRRKVKLTLKVEAIAIATLGIYALAEDRTIGAVSLPFGRVAAGKGATLICNNLQVGKVTPDEDGNAASWTIEFHANGGTDGNSDYELLFA